MNRASEPLTLKVKHADDLALQLAMHRMNACAVSLHGSRMAHKITAQTPAPYAQVKADYSGSDLVPLLDASYARWVALQRKWYAAGDDWKHAEQIEREMTREAARAAKLAATLSVPGGRGYGGGQHGVYAVTVPPVEYTGGIQGTWEAERFTLDVHALPGDLRDRLKAYLLSGAEMLPYWHCATRQRYYARSVYPKDARDMMGQLLAHLTPDTRKVAPRGNDLQSYCASA